MNKAVSNLETSTANKEQQRGAENEKNIDYGAIIIIAIIILCIGAWGILTKIDVLEPLFL